MKPLTARQAATCETAKTPPSKCRCRCGGAGHGKGRSHEAQREFFEALPEEDPHHVPPTKEREAELDYLKRQGRLDL